MWLFAFLPLLYVALNVGHKTLWAWLNTYKEGSIIFSELKRAISRHLFSQVKFMPKRKPLLKSLNWSHFYSENSDLRNTNYSYITQLTPRLKRKRFFYLLSSCLFSHTSMQRGILILESLSLFLIARYYATLRAFPPPQAEGRGVAGWVVITTRAGIFWKINHLD